MRAAFEDRSVNQAVIELQRLALRAAMIGFSISVGIVILYSATQRFAASNTGMRASLEGICALLWPSAILMLGAQTYHGGIVLFLLSACLNAGYFVLATTLPVAVIHRFNFAASASKASAVTGQVSAGPLSETLRRARPIA
jgi:hypothetical protein